MSILRAKTIDLIQTTELTKLRQENSKLNEFEALSQTEILKSYPRRLVFELTNACNLNCIMCGRNAVEFKPTVFDFNWTRNFDDILDKVEEVTLMGWGEPTIHPEFKRFLYWAYDNGLRKYFCTNGMKLDVLFNDIFETKTDVIAISLDGADAVTNNRIRRGSDYNKILDNIKNIVEEKERRNLKYPYMNFVFTAMKSNFHQIPQMVKLAKEIGIQEVKVVYLTIFDKSMLGESLYNCSEELKQVFNEAEELAEKLGILLKLPYIQGEDIAGEKLHKDCFVAWRDFFLGSDGWVRSCMSTSVKLFNIKDCRSFEDMWNSKEYIDVRQKVNNFNMSESCKKCYQSSFANWNNESTFIQIGNNFSPKWQN